MRKCPALTIILLAMLVAGCAFGPQVVNTWRDPAYTGGWPTVLLWVNIIQAIGLMIEVK